MQGKDKNQAPMIQVINIEALVPQNYILRYVDQAVDFSFIRERTKSLYTEGLGRYSIPPELVLRAFLLQYLFNLSDRMLCNEMAMHAGFRWFCRLNPMRAFTGRVAGRRPNSGTWCTIPSTCVRV